MSEIFITRNIPVPSLTLNNDDLNKLKLILDKTGSSPTFNIETDTEELAFDDFQSLAEQHWPTNIKRLSFDTGYSGRRISGLIYTNNIYGLSHITLNDNDKDWISARTEELKQFLDQHRNMHYLFQNIKHIVAQGLLLVALLDYWIITYLIQRDWKDFIVLAILITFYGAWYLYGSLLPKVFPFLVLEPEHPSSATRLRYALKYLMPAVFVGLLIQLIWGILQQ